MPATAAFSTWGAAGEYSLLFAADGAEVVSIDTSAQAIERLQEHCKLNDVTNLHAVLRHGYETSGCNGHAA